MKGKVIRLVSNKMFRVSIILIVSIWAHTNTSFTGLVTSLFGDYYMIYLAFFLYFWIISFVVVITEFTKMGIEKIHLFEVKNRKTPNNTLYEWLAAENIQEDYFLDFLGDRNKSDVLQNLLQVKLKITNKVGSKIEGYYLLKNYLEMKVKNHPSNSINAFLISLISVIISTTIATQVRSGYFSKILKDLFPEGDMLQEEIIVKVIIISGVVLAIYQYIRAMWVSTTRNTRRYKLLISILDVIIQEKEKNKVKSFI